MRLGTHVSIQRVANLTNQLIHKPITKGNRNWLSNSVMAAAADTVASNSTPTSSPPRKDYKPRYIDVSYKCIAV